jgi:hypothetical protein
MKKILVLISMFTLVAFLSTTTVSAQKVAQKVTTEKTTKDKAVAKDAKCADKPASCEKSCAKKCSGDTKKACCAGKEGAKTETEAVPVPKK